METKVTQFFLLRYFQQRQNLSLTPSADMSSIQTSEECLSDLLHFSECFTSNKEECPDHNEKCTQLRVQYNHAIDVRPFLPSL